MWLAGGTYRLSHQFALDVIAGLTSVKAYTFSVAALNNAGAGRPVVVGLITVQ